ncbi:MAG: Hsp70 family protein [Myxococcales bacterium]|nr:Hsp70 family protein [Myxococcales bacterium]
MTDHDHPPLGIDLGTTHSLVAVFESDGPRVLEHDVGSFLVPSEVAIDDEDHLLVGAPARTVRLRRPDRGLARFKPDMGQSTSMPLGDTVLTPTTASALILKELKEVAEARLGFPVHRAVISVPAWFREPQRKATLDAGRFAGFEVQRLINEPTAAALAHGLHVDGDLRRVAVLDLGGGTFDVTVLELFDGIVDVRSSVGDVHLGGEDVTDAIVAWLNQRTTALSIDPATLARRRRRAERAKRLLSGQASVSIDLPDEDGGSVPLDQQTLEQLCAPLLQRMRSLVSQALVQAATTARDIDQVVLVGGAVRMPVVRQFARRMFEQEPLPLGEVDQLVALGAAVQAALVDGHEALRERLVTDVLTHSLGVSAVQSWADQHYQDRFVPLLGRGTTLPASKAERFSTLHHQQNEVVLEVFEGERRVASDNHLLGTLSVPVPTHDDAEARESLEVRFTHDVSGLLEVEATVLSTDERSAVVIERGGQTYDEQARLDVQAQLARLKVHPRQLLPNRWLLERATTVVEHLAGPARDELDQMLLAFEAALDGGDMERIEQWRVPLSARVGELEALLQLDLPS